MINIKIEFSRDTSDWVYTVIRNDERAWSCYTLKAGRYVCLDQVTDLSVRKMFERVRRAIKLLEAGRY